MRIEVYIGKWIIASKFYLSENIIKNFILCRFRQNRQQSTCHPEKTHTDESICRKQRTNSRTSGEIGKHKANMPSAAATS